jgi:hypothetical protein
MQQTPASYIGRAGGSLRNTALFFEERERKIRKFLSALHVFASMDLVINYIINTTFHLFLHFSSTINHEL